MKKKVIIERIGSNENINSEQQIEKSEKKDNRPKPSPTPPKKKDD